MMSEIVPALAVLFTAAAGILFLFQQFNFSVYPAYIGTGILVGYWLDITQFQTIAGLGLLFLIFSVGLHTRTRHLSRNWQSIGLAVAVHIVLLILIVVVVAHISGLGGQSAILLSMAIALSSTLVGHDLVAKEVRLNLMHGRIAEGINIVQDIIAVFLIVLFLTYPISASTVVNGLIAIGLVVLAFGGRPYAGTVLNRITGKRPELVMVWGLAMLLLILTATEHFGLSAIIGAYVAGILFSRPVEDADLIDTLDPLQDFFTAFAFIFIGALLTVPTIPVLLITGLLIVAKLVLAPVLVFATLIWRGNDSRTAYLTAFRLDQVSEFTVIAALTGFMLNLVPVAVFQGILLAFSITMVTSAVTTRFSEQIYEAIFARIGLQESRHTMEHSHLPDALQNHIIVAGYGNTGQALVDQLSTDRPIVVIDYDPEANRAANEHGISHVFGDMLYPGTWDRVNSDKATLIVAATTDPAINARIMDHTTDAHKIVLTEEDTSAEDITDNISVFSRTKLTSHAVTAIIEEYLAQDEL